MTFTELVLAALLATGAFGQSTVTVHAQQSAIPPYYPNAYRNNTNQNAQPNTPWSNRTDENGNFESSYSPARGPAIPLAVRSPYTNAWTSTGNNGSLNSNPVIFWDGSALGWEGIVTVDGVSYEWMGVGSRDLPQLDTFLSATPRSVAYDSQYSNFTLDAGPVEIYASFFSPVIPQDLCRTSIPLSYLTVTVNSLDGAPHNVSLYTDINGGWVTQPSAPLTWDIYENRQIVDATNVTDYAGGIFTWVIQLQTQYEFGENNGQAPQEAGQGVFPQWGNFTFSSSQGQAQDISFQSGYSVNQRFKYVTGTGLSDVVDKNYRAFDEQEPVFAYQHDLGMVGTNGSASVTFTIGHVVQPAIKYLTSEGIERLQPWWSRCYQDFWSMLIFHWNDMGTVSSLAAAQEAKLKNDINQYFGLNDAVYSNSTPSTAPEYWYNGTNGMAVTGTDQFGQQYIFDSGNAYGYLEPPNGCNSTGIAIPNVSEAESYYAIVALAARQVIAGYELTVPSNTSSNQSEPLAWQKEISSNGNVNTVDVIFPAMPFFLWSNPDFLRYVLTPLFENQEHNFYPNDYSMHDLGSRFPNATGHVEGNDEYMPVEESGNMIIMSYAIYKFSSNLAYLEQNYAILKQWAQYLIEYSLVPAVQLSTDDFAGQLANQTNLAIKGIVGLAAMAEISTAVGDTTSASNYSSTAQSYYEQWTNYGIDPSGEHTLLAYQWRSSWGLLYNVYPAKLLGLDIIPQSLYDMQSSFYPTVSQLWGVPLDSRHSYTKSDWEMWTAAYCQPETRRLFVDALAYWLNTTSSTLPFSDLFQTIHTGETLTGSDPLFIARPVQGGLFSFLALLAGGTN